MQPNALRHYKPSTNNHYKGQTPTPGSTDSCLFIVHLYPLGCAMIPLSGIMPSQGIRHEGNPSATNTSWPINQEECIVLGDEINRQITRRLYPRTQATT